MCLGIYVDDVILIVSSKKFIAWCKKNLANEFDMEDIDIMQYFLYLEVWKGTCEVFVGQGKYIVEILKVL